jgi:hypothetical protein
MDRKRRPTSVRVQENVRVAAKRGISARSSTSCTASYVRICCRHHQPALSILTDSSVVNLPRTACERAEGNASVIKPSLEENCFYETTNAQHQIPISSKLIHPDRLN